MIYQALELIRYNINQFVSYYQNKENMPEPVLLGNIAFSTQDNPATPMDESAQIYMTLVNVEEEFTFKNQSAVRPSLNSLTGVEYKNPSLHLNLYILFTANHKDYATALQDLGNVLLYLQSNRVITLAQNPHSSFDTKLSYEERANFKIRLDLISLTFEQINHLWGSLGGKQMPFVLIKASKIEIDADQTIAGGGVIQNINIR